MKYPVRPKIESSKWLYSLSAKFCAFCVFVSSTVCLADRVDGYPIPYFCPIAPFSEAIKKPDEIKITEKKTGYNLSHVDIELANLMRSYKVWGIDLLEWISFSNYLTENINEVENLNIPLSSQKTEIEEPSLKGHWDSSSVKDFETKLHVSPSLVLKDQDFSLPSVQFYLDMQPFAIFNTIPQELEISNSFSHIYFPYKSKQDFFQTINFHNLQRIYIDDKKYNNNIWDLNLSDWLPLIAKDQEAQKPNISSSQETQYVTQSNNHTHSPEKSVTEVENVNILLASQKTEIQINTTPRVETIDYFSRIYFPDKSKYALFQTINFHNLQKLYIDEQKYKNHLWGINLSKWLPSVVIDKEIQKPNASSSQEVQHVIQTKKRETHSSSNQATYYFSQSNKSTDTFNEVKNVNNREQITLDYENGSWYDTCYPCSVPIFIPSIHYRGGSGRSYKKGYETIEAFLALFHPCDNFYQFVDLKLHRVGEGRFAANLGIGLRGFSPYYEEMLGLNIYYDYRRFFQGDFQQIGIGAEFFGKNWDIRANGYAPIGAKRTLIETTMFEYLGGAFAERETYEAAMWGADFEIGKCLLSHQCMTIYGAVGSYFYGSEFCSCDCEDDFDCCNTFAGGMVRLAANFWKNLTVQLHITHDRQFHTKVQGEVILSLPLPCSLDCLRCLFMPVWRNDIILTEKTCCWNSNF